MTKLNCKIENALVSMDFIKRYEELSARFSSERAESTGRLEQVERNKVMEMLKQFGFSPKFDAKERFYKINEEQVGTFTFGFHILLRDGMADLEEILRTAFEMYKDFKLALTQV